MPYLSWKNAWTILSPRGFMASSGIRRKSSRLQIYINKWTCRNAPKCKDHLNIYNESYFLLELKIIETKAVWREEDFDPNPNQWTFLFSLYVQQKCKIISLISSWAKTVGGQTWVKVTSYLERTGIKATVVRNPVIKS